jgi:hypothetical protein
MEMVNNMEWQTMYNIWIKLGSPSYISVFTLLGLIIKLVNDIYNKSKLYKIEDEILVIYLKIQELEMKIK